MSLDLLFSQASLPGQPTPMDLGVKDGHFVAMAPRLEADCPRIEVQGRAVLAGFVDTHIHLDKACLLGRCGHITGGLASAIKAVSAMKAGFTEEDVYQRGALVLEKAISKGTMHMRTHVEVDPRAGLRSFNAIKQLKRDYGWALDLSLCVFPQEGLTNDPGTEALLEQALREGADLLGGCPYTDTDPHEQIARLFAMAKRFDVDLDFHLDFDLDPSWMHLHEICRQTIAHGYEGRVAIGHVTKLSAVTPEVLGEITGLLARSGVAVTVLPATDLYLTARDATHLVPRGLTPAHRLVEAGVVCSIATNNVMNPFTPFGDCSLLRMANFYANVAQVSPADFPTCIDLVTTLPAKLMKLETYGVKLGAPADLIILDGPDHASAMAELKEPVAGFKRGRASFERPTARLMPPQ